MSSRFKYIVDVKYGENRGQGKVWSKPAYFFNLGVTCSFRALWDSDSDKHQSAKENLTIFTVNFLAIFQSVLDSFDYILS